MLVITAGRPPSPLLRHGVAVATGSADVACLGGMCGSLVPASADWQAAELGQKKHQFQVQHSICMCKAAGEGTPTTGATPHPNLQGLDLQRLASAVSFSATEDRKGRPAAAELPTSCTPSYTHCRKQIRCSRHAQYCLTASAVASARQPQAELPEPQAQAAQACAGRAWPGQAAADQAAC